MSQSQIGKSFLGQIDLKIPSNFENVNLTSNQSLKGSRRRPSLTGDSIAKSQIQMEFRKCKIPSLVVEELPLVSCPNEQMSSKQNMLAKSAQKNNFRKFQNTAKKKKKKQVEYEERHKNSKIKNVSTKENSEIIPKTNSSKKLRKRRTDTPSKVVSRFNKKGAPEAGKKVKKLDYSEYYQEMKLREQKRSSMKSLTSRRKVPSYADHLNLKLDVKKESRREYNGEYSGTMSDPRKITSAKKIDFQGFIGKKKLTKTKSQYLKKNHSKMLSASGKKSRKKNKTSHSIHQESSKKPKMKYNSLQKMTMNRRKIEHLRSLMEKMDSLSESQNQDPLHNSKL